MIEWEQKLKLKEIPRASNKTSKNPWTQNLTPRPITQNICCFKRNILYRKTTSHSFEYPLKFILKSSHPKNYLLISGAHSPPPLPLKFLRSPPSFKIRSTPSSPERSTRCFLDVGAFVEKERVTKPYKFGTVREAHARTSVERERNKQGSVKCVVILALRSTEEEKKETACCLGLAKWSWKSDASLLFFSFFVF